MVSAPGFSKGEKMVKSKSGSVPHMVSIDHGSPQYKCDDKCLQDKSGHICSHTVAPAEVDGDLAKFLHFLRHKCAPNLMPNGSRISRRTLPVLTKKVGLHGKHSEVNQLEH